MCELETDIGEIVPGDVVVVCSGEKIAVDGTIVSGSAEIDEAIITGRSESEHKAAGDRFFAGTILEKGRIQIRVQGVGSDTYMAHTIASVEASLSLRSPAQLEADRLAASLLKLGSLLTAAAGLFSPLTTAVLHNGTTIGLLANSLKGISLDSRKLLYDSNNRYQKRNPDGSFFPIVSGVATIITAALTYETCKGTNRKIQKRKRRKHGPGT